MTGPLNALIALSLPALNSANALGSEAIESLHQVSRSSLEALAVRPFRSTIFSGSSPVEAISENTSRAAVVEIVPAVMSLTVKQVMSF